MSPVYLVFQTIIISIEFSPVVDIDASKGHILPQETTSRNITFELCFIWLLFNATYEYIIRSVVFRL